MVKGISYTLEATIAGLIIVGAIATFVVFDAGSTSDVTTLREEGFRCLKNIDERGLMRSSVNSSNAAAIDSEISGCIKSAVNHEILICRQSCTASSAPSNREKVIANYYVAGYTDKDPANVALVMWT